MSDHKTKSTSRDVSHISSELGVLYVVATPIGNLADITQRAIDVLSQVDTVLAEDTRHSKPLLQHYGIKTSLKACHEHNEQSLLEWVKSALLNGHSLALISDAGTPLISDPGFVIVRELRENGFRVEVVPGASSVVAALSVSGLPTDKFIFDGFLAAKQAARKKQLAEYLHESRTIVLLESSHRIVACLSDVVDVLGAQRKVVIARELTKKFETVLAGSSSSVLQSLLEDANQTRGEFVLLLSGVTSDNVDGDQVMLERTLRTLLVELPVKQAASIAANLCDVGKNQAYQLALKIKKKND